MELSKLRLWDKNPRGIEKKEFERLKRLIKDLGLFKPFIVTEDGEVLGGNMRLRACRELGINDVPVSVVKAKTDAEKLKIALADNDRVGYYEEQELAELISGIPDIDLGDYKIDLGKTVSIEELLNKFRPVEEDEVPEVEEGEAESKLGEVYQLGRHRLMCGDATKIEDVEKLMDGKKADMVFTDPPYGIAYKSPTGSGMTKRGGYDVIEGDDKDFDPSCLFGHCEKIVTWGANHYADKLTPSAQWLVWDKREGDAINNNSDCELAWCSFGGSARLFHHKWNGMIKASEKKDKRVHPTQKPIALCSWSLNETKAGNNILDLFGGSGSTLIACEQTNRTCYMMELDPKYCDVIRKRYDNFINKNGKVTANG